MNNKKTLTLSLSLLIYSALALAELPSTDWVQYASSTKSSFDIYYSPSSIKSESGYKKVTILKNFNEPQQFTAEKPYFKFLSSVEAQLIDCQKKSYRGTRTEKWTELWGKGKLGRAYDYEGSKKNGWSNPIKDTQIEGALMDKVCQ